MIGAVQDKRSRLIDSAAILFHHHGVTATSLVDIARHADIPIGNVYYYFKTKEELALAAIGRRKEQFSAAYAMLEESIADPRQRLIESVKYFESVREEYGKYGCPIGRIVNDADVEKDVVVRTAAQVLMDYVDWAEQQFRQLGYGAEARKYATSVMSGIQGATVMAKALRHPQIISDEIVRLVNWLETIPNIKIRLGKASAKAPTLSDAA